MIKKPFSWSYSALLDFENCPRAYAAKKVYKTVKEVESPAMRWGNEVHKAMELRLAQKKPLPDTMQKWEKYARAFESAVTIDSIHCEMEMAITRDFQFTDWFGKDTWARAKIDLLVMTDGGLTAKIYDYKTGSKMKDDDTQLRLFAAFTMLKFPNVQRVFAQNIWLELDKVSPPITVLREFVGNEWADISARVGRMERAWIEEKFPERPSGLCKAHCPVLECPHNGKQ